MLSSLGGRAETVAETFERHTFTNMHTSLLLQGRACVATFRDATTVAEYQGLVAQLSDQQRAALREALGPSVLQPWDKRALLDDLAV